MKIKQLSLLLGILLTVAGCTTIKNKDSANMYKQHQLAQPRPADIPLLSSITPSIENVVPPPQPIQRNFSNAIPPAKNFHGIEIKGIHIGMTKSEVTEKIGFKRFTVAGVKSTMNLLFNYHEGKLDQFIFVFDPKEFNTIFEAVKEKYPALICEDYAVSNLMGASFQQMNCSVNDSETSLLLTRFSTDFKTSALSLTSQRLSNELIKQQNDKMKDI